MVSAAHTSSTQNDSTQVKLAKAFHVKDVPVAIFVVILICLICVSAVTFIVLCVISTVRRSRMQVERRKHLKSVYIHEPAVEKKNRIHNGQLGYKIMFDKWLHTIYVVIMEATDLHSTCNTETLDAYVSLKLTILKHGKLLQVGKPYKTEVQRRSKLPRWNYPCSFEVVASDLAYITLIFDVLEYDSIGQERHLGQLTVPLSKFNINEYTGIFLEGKGWLHLLEPRSEGPGELYVGLTYKPTADLLEVFVYEARQLAAFNLIPVFGSYCVNVKVELRYRRKLLGTFTTKSKNDLVNPYFNEKVQFTLQKKFVTEAYVLCRLRFARRLSETLEVASLTIGPNSGLATGAKHWEEMLRNSPRTHVSWHIWNHSSTKQQHCSIL
ncbi:hypothetical protein P879_00157 [Paragonimus westermani]|uniref:C2 domain-containing protein n=1 Tax=Paragonimus westermani TaxID=34504 RepID=A0A8T0E180_9TREM|nr:hypothetical protein P879_00157 [Paragonimus westermani]